MLCVIYIWYCRDAQIINHITHMGQGSIIILQLNNLPYIWTKMSNILRADYYSEFLVVIYFPARRLEIPIIIYFFKRCAAKLWGRPPKTLKWKPLLLLLNLQITVKLYYSLFLDYHHHLPNQTEQMRTVIRIGTIKYFTLLMSKSLFCDFFF